MYSCANVFASVAANRGSADVAWIETTSACASLGGDTAALTWSGVTTRMRWAVRAATVSSDTSSRLVAASRDGSVELGTNVDPKSFWSNCGSRNSRTAFAVYSFG